MIRLGRFDVLREKFTTMLAFEQGESAFLLFSFWIFSVFAVYRSGAQGEPPVLIWFAGVALTVSSFSSLFPSVFLSLVSLSLALFLAAHRAVCVCAKFLTLLSVRFSFSFAVRSGPPSSRPSLHLVTSSHRSHKHFSLKSTRFLSAPSL